MRCPHCSAERVTSATRNTTLRCRSCGDHFKAPAPAEPPPAPLEDDAPAGAATPPAADPAPVPADDPEDVHGLEDDEPEPEQAEPDPEPEPAAGEVVVVETIDPPAPAEVVPAGEPVAPPPAPEDPQPPAPAAPADPSSSSSSMERQTRMARSLRRRVRGNNARD